MVAEETVREPVDRHPVAQHELVERGPVALEEARHESSIIVLTLRLNRHRLLWNLRLRPEQGGLAPGGATRRGGGRAETRCGASQTPLRFQRTPWGVSSRMMPRPRSSSRM